MVMENLIQSLWVQWQRSLAAVAAVALSPDVVAGTFARLVDAYASPGRYYHTLEHIHQVLAIVQRFQDSATAPDLIKLAVWFHDVVYDATAKDNEQRSVDCARDWLQALHVPTRDLDTISRLIFSTQRHEPVIDTIDNQIFLDADLAILSAETPHYWQYAIAIRQEYAWMTEAQYRLGRRDVLEQFLQREFVYFTAPMRTTAETTARANLTAEIAQLRNADGAFSPPWPNADCCGF